MGKTKSKVPLKATLTNSKSRTTLLSSGSTSIRTIGMPSSLDKVYVPSGKARSHETYSGIEPRRENPYTIISPSARKITYSSPANVLAYQSPSLRNPSPKGIGRSSYHNKPLKYIGSNASIIDQNKNNYILNCKKIYSDRVCPICGRNH